MKRMSSVVTRWTAAAAVVAAFVCMPAENIAPATVEAQGDVDQVVPRRRRATSTKSSLRTLTKTCAGATSAPRAAGG